MAAVSVEVVADPGPAPEVDRLLLVPVLLLAAIGVVMVASASLPIAEARGVGSFHFLVRHLGYLALGAALAAIAVRHSLSSLERFGSPALLAAFAMLPLVFVPGLGHEVNGAARWIRIGPLQMQVVEPVKLLLIVFLAAYLARHQQALQTRFLAALLPLLVASILAAMLLLQPDFGSAVLIAAIAGGMLWLGGARVRFLIAPALLALPVLAWAALSEGYRLRRLTSFLDPWSDPFRDGFQLTQALIAVGRGEWLGVGLGASVQKLYYLPEAHNDFMVAVFAEEFGLLGLAVLIGLFSLLVGRSFVLAMRLHAAGRGFAAHLMFGIALWIGLQALVSIGVNLGVLPTKGLTLPLISSGGSSLVVTLIAVGLLLAGSREAAAAAAGMPTEAKR
ncbi:MAG: putative lipid II flippase FtsW [Lysobacterales bacterium]|jgi:cell division protein FtsW|nr:MAG: putative lipid II flippase FtsW [Xanthomonadales bacterium]